jgi:Sulfotransferase domain
VLRVRQVLSHKPHDFTKMTAEEGFELAPPGSIDESTLLNEPGWTLFEYDFPRNRAIFIDVGPDGDVVNVPFAYSTQMRLAKRWAAIDLEAFLALSRDIKTSQRFIQFQNIGHCGSTLLHHVFNASGSVWDFSEPKFTRDIAMNRKSLSREKQVELAKAGLKFLTLYPHAGKRDVIAVKHFSQGTKIFDIWQAAFASAKTIFMYRDAMSWCNSDYGFWQRWGLPAPMPFSERHFVWDTESGFEGEEYLKGLVDFNREGVTFAELSACSWALHVEEFLRARQSGLNAMALRYNELLSDRDATLKAVFDFCGVVPQDMEEVLRTFEADAHEGEVTAHSKVVQKLTPDDASKILRILGNPRVALLPDVML